MTTIPASERSMSYAPVAATGPFPIDFPVFDGTGADLRVTLDDVEVTGLTFSGTIESGFYGEPNTWVSGSITFAAPITGALVIDGVRDPRRQGQYAEGRGIPARDHNTELNILTATDQELRRDVGREETKRKSEIVRLDGRIDDETAARQADVSALDGRVTTAEGELVLQDQRIDALGGIIAGVPFPIDGLEFRPEQFPLVPELSRVQAAADAAWALGGALRLRSGVTYEYDMVDLKPGLVVRSSGAVWRHDGSTTGGQIALTISDGVIFDEIFATTPGTETAANLISVGKNVRGKSLFAISDVQRAGRAITGTGEGVCIERIMMRRFDDQLWFDGRALAPTQPAGGIIGIIDGDGYLTGARFNYLSFNIGYLQMTERSSHAAGVM